MLGEKGCWERNAQGPWKQKYVYKETKAGQIAIWPMEVSKYLQRNKRSSKLIKKSLSLLRTDAIEKVIRKLYLNFILVSWRA